MDNLWWVYSTDSWGDHGFIVVAHGFPMGYPWEPYGAPVGIPCDTHKMPRKGAQKERTDT